MNKQGSAEIILRFVRSVLLLDVLLAVIVGVITLLLDLHTLEAYGTLLVWTSVVVLLLACALGVGGISARIEDVGAYSLSGAGNMTENLQRIADSGRSSLGCFSVVLVAGIVLLVIGLTLQILFAL